MLHAFKLFTGPDDALQVVEGTVAQNDPSEAASVYFKESPPHSSLDWHDAPERQCPTAADNVGTGHKWRLIDDQLGGGSYVVLQPGAHDALVANK